MTVGLVIGKFMPFHVGHELLVDFALTYGARVGHDVTYVAVCILPDEPIDGGDRFRAVVEHYQSYPQVHVKLVDKILPQDPSEAEDFWQQWTNELQEIICGESVVVFSSESYGEQLAYHLGGHHMPVNIDRDIYPISGTSCREDIIQNWDMVIPEMRRSLNTTVTLFGAESVGKTTIGKWIAERFGGTFVPEYARGYLELKGTDKLSLEDFDEFVEGQIATAYNVHMRAHKPLVVQDTDIVTTIGWFKLMHPGQKIPDKWIEAANALAPNMYIVLDDNVEFTPDPLRYGGDVRQSDTKFWTDLLDEFGMEYQVVDGLNGLKRLAQTRSLVRMAINQ